MNRSELQDAWTRMLAGETLSPAELAAVEDALQLDIDEAGVQWMRDDLHTDELLRAVFAGDQTAAETENSDRQFAEQVRSRIVHAAAVHPVQPPPMVQTVVTRTTTAQHNPPPSATRRRKPGALNYGIVAAGAAVILLIGTAAIWLGDGLIGRQPAVNQPELATADAVPSTQQLAEVPAPAPPAMEPEVMPQVITPLDNVDSPQTVVLDPRSDNRDSMVPKEVDQPPIETESPQESIAINRPPESPSRNATEHIATVKETKNAVWQDGYRPPTQLLAGKLELVSGDAVLRLRKGTELTLAGPVTLELVDENRVVLANGTLEALVTQQAIGFEVQTAGARIVDLGTRFRVTTNPDQKSTAVTVIDGTVEVTQPNPRIRGRARKVRLTEGQTKWMSHDSYVMLDWRMVIKFGDPATKANELSIDGRAFDVSRADQVVTAMNEIGRRFEDARKRMKLLPRGQRFAGSLLVNDTVYNVSTDKSLRTTQTQLLQLIQQRWSKNMFEQIFPQGVPPALENFFMGNGLPLPGVNQ